ncbi:hypothetical protein BH11PSE11_BH11PSE11_32910 [soil metagenome]
MDTVTAAREIADRFDLPDHAQAAVRLGMDALLRHGIVNAKTAPSYAKTMSEWLIKEKSVPNTTDIVALKAALESGARAILDK